VATPSPVDRVDLFVYGTLMPGHLRWPMIRAHVLGAEDAAVPGVLYDTGYGYPAARFDGAADGTVPGSVLSLRATALDLIDRIEGPGYRRTAVVTDAGRPVESYEWVGSLDGMTVLVGRWTTGDER
jgi:gamma-glutamylcyclotransferase (GGCT)/AIG2-like uncharacterized protein YtfP